MLPIKNFIVDNDFLRIILLQYFTYIFVENFREGLSVLGGWALPTRCAIRVLQ